MAGETISQANTQPGCQMNHPIMSRHREGSPSSPPQGQRTMSNGQGQKPTPTEESGRMYRDKNGLADILKTKPNSLDATPSVCEGSTTGKANAGVNEARPYREFQIEQSHLERTHQSEEAAKDRQFQIMSSIMGRNRAP